jgi:hypothetical protein
MAWMVSFTPRSLYRRGKSPRWIGGCVGPRAGTEAVEKIKITGPCRESNPGRPALDLVTILTRILKYIRATPSAFRSSSIISLSFGAVDYYIIPPGCMCIGSSRMLSRCGIHSTACFSLCYTKQPLHEWRIWNEVGSSRYRALTTRHLLECQAFLRIMPRAVSRNLLVTAARARTWLGRTLTGGPANEKVRGSIPEKTSGWMRKPVHGAELRMTRQGLEMRRIQHNLVERAFLARSIRGKECLYVRPVTFLSWNYWTDSD